MGGTDTMAVYPKWTRWLTLLVAGLASACGRQNDRPEPPPNPEVVEVPVVSYVPIDPDLTARCKWRKSAPQTEIHSVARERKGCLEFYEANIGAISRVQGKPVPTPAIRPASEESP